MNINVDQKQGFIPKVLAFILGFFFFSFFLYFTVFSYFISKQKAENYYKNAIKVRGVVCEVNNGKRKSTLFSYYYNSNLYYNFDLSIDLNIGDSLDVYFFPENPKNSMSEYLIDKWR